MLKNNQHFDRISDHTARGEDFSTGSIPVCKGKTVNLSDSVLQDMMDEVLGADARDNGVVSQPGKRKVPLRQIVTAVFNHGDHRGRAVTFTVSELSAACRHRLHESVHGYTFINDPEEATVAA